MAPVVDILHGISRGLFVNPFVPSSFKQFDHLWSQKELPDIPGI